MASDAVVVAGHHHPHPKQTPTKAAADAAANPAAEPDYLACPRCESTNTKFCYYNNYNLSQPRYFCKGCRRYWTRGGTLRNVPVGGGSRKKPSSSYKRSRLSSAPLHPPLLSPTTSFSEGVNANQAAVNVDEPSTSFMSLLTATDQYGQGLGLGLGYGLELGFGHAGFDEIGLGFGFGSSGENQLGGGSDGSSSGGVSLVMDGGDCFAWPDLTISTPLD